MMSARGLDPRAEAAPVASAGAPWVSVSVGEAPVRERVTLVMVPLVEAVGMAETEVAVVMTVTVLAPEEVADLDSVEEAEDEAEELASEPPERAMGPM
jgi:hypothetical protein